MYASKRGGVGLSHYQHQQDKHACTLIVASQRGDGARAKEPLLPRDTCQVFSQPARFPGCSGYEGTVANQTRYRDKRIRSSC